MKLIKRYYKYIIIAFCILLYLILRLAVGKSFLLYIIIPLLGFLLYYVITFYNDYKQKELESSDEFISKNVDEENESKLSEIQEKLGDMEEENPGFADVIDSFLRKVDSFAEKGEALKDLISMNDDAAKKFLQARRQAVTNNVILNAKKLIKALIAYKAMSKRNRPSSIDEVDAVKEVFTDMDNMATAYDQLLDEVSKMGDDFNPEDPGLKEAVQNLQEMRVSLHVKDDEPEELHLFVNNSSSSSG